MKKMLKLYASEQSASYSMHKDMKAMDWVYASTKDRILRTRDLEIRYVYQGRVEKIQGLEFNKVWYDEACDAEAALMALSRERA